MTRSKTDINSLFEGGIVEGVDEHVAKRQRCSVPNRSSAVEKLLAQGGCVWSTDSCSVYDLHTFRGTLTSTLTFRKELIREVVGDIAKALSDPDRLRTACLPLMCTQGTCMSETLMQVLLTTQCLEEPVTEIILEKLVEVCNEERSSTSHSASRDEEIPLHEQPFPQLLLAQLQILDNGNCTEKIASFMIEAFESLPPPMKAQICTILGEVVPPEHIADVIQALQAAVTQHTELALPVCTALKRLPMSLAQRMDSVDGMLRHLSSVPAEHVADVAFYIMQHCTSGSHSVTICKTLREVLRFGCAEDMRMPLECDKVDSAPAPLNSPEAVLILKFRFQSKALGHISDAFQKIWERISDTHEWRILDVWWLLVAHHANSGAHSSILKSFQSAFNRVPMDLKLVCQALQGHELSLKVFHGTMTSIATASISTPAGGLGRRLLQALLILPHDQKSESYQRSSPLALSALQSTLASITCNDTNSTNAAIEVLLECSEESCAFFLKQHELFVRVMARLEHLQDSQIHKLSKLFGKLIVQEAAPADEMIDTAAYPFTSAAQQHYDNRLAAADASKKCIAVVGILHWVFALAAAGPDLSELARAKLEMLVERLQKLPALMAFLLDTFSDMLVSQFRQGSLNTVENPILVQIRDYLGETLLESVLMSEIKDGMPEKKSTVSVPGGPIVKVQLWMSTATSVPETCCNLLYRLMSTDVSEKQYAQVLAPALKCISITDQALSGYGFESLDCLPGLPFALYSMQFLHAPVFQKLQPAFRAAVLEGLLVLCNWLCELTNAYGLVLENPQHQKQEVPPVIRAQVMLRVSQLGKVHMLLLSLLSLEANPVLEDGLSCMAAARPAGFNASAWMSPEGNEDCGDHEDAATAKPKVNSKAQACLKRALRPLIPDALNLLHWIPWGNLSESCSLGDMYMSLRLLLSDFCSKACATASAAKRPAAFRAAAAANAASEDTIIMCAQRCLPALRQVLQHAHTDHGKLIDGHCLDDPESVWASFGNEDKAVEVLDDTPWETLLPATTNITNSHMACTETLVLSLKCFSALLSLPSIKMPQHIQFLGELLSTYSAASCKDAAGHVVPLKINFSQPAWHATLEAPKLTDLVQLLKKTFDFMASLLRGPKGVLDHDVLVVRVLRELCSVPDTVLHAAGVSDVGILEHFPTQQRRDVSNMWARVSAAAKGILWARWDGLTLNEADGEAPVDAVWKQRPAQDLAEVLSLFISAQERPEDLVSELACNELASVKAGTGDPAMHMCHGCPALCTATFPTWYRVLFKQLVDRFALLVQQAVASTNTAGGAANTRLLTQDLQGQIDTACSAFASLAKLVKHHDSNQTILQAALRSGGKFTELFLKLKKWFKQRGSGDEIKRVVLSAQKGTRVVQTICAEAKAQRMGSVARLVPSTKKNLEKFVQFVRVILQESTAGRFWVGQLKHKNLRGEIVPATIESDEDDVDDEDEYDSGGGDAVADSEDEQ